MQTSFKYQQNFTLNLKISLKSLFPILLLNIAIVAWPWLLAFLHVVATNSTPNPRHCPSPPPVEPQDQHRREVAEVKGGLDLKVHLKTKMLQSHLLGMLSIYYT